MGQRQGDAARGSDRGMPPPSPLPTGGSSLDSLGDILQGPLQVKLCRSSSLSLAASPGMCTWAFPLALNDSRYQQENREGEDESLILTLPCYLSKMEEALLK